MELIDIGVNLTHRQFEKDRDQVIDRAVASGVVAMVITGTSERSSRSAKKLASARPGVLFSTAGVHPHDAKSCTKGTLGALRELAQAPEVVAIGECGLDYNRDFSPRLVQDRWFEAQLELAIELKLPVFLHERDSHDRFLEILRVHRDALPAAVIHCFTGTAEELGAYLDLDLHVGITGWICDERRGRHLRGLVGRIPFNRLMVETDAPFLVPRDLRPRRRRNEPANLSHIAGTLAECSGRTPREVAEITTETAQAFFGLNRD